MDLTTLICREAEYMLEYKSTIRETGRVFNRSKSAVHKDMREKLPQIDKTLAKEVATLLNFNTEERARRGGLARQDKYKRKG